MLNDLVDQAFAGEFERARGTSTSLDTCPFLPEPLREQVLRLLAAQPNVTQADPSHGSLRDLPPHGVRRPAGRGLGWSFAL